MRASRFCPSVAFAALKSRSRTFLTNAVLRLARSDADLTAAARSDGSTALHMAVLCQRIDVIEALLDAGAPLEAKARNDTTALHCAAMQGHTQTLRYLLDKHASLNARTADGETPLHLAVKTNNLNCAVMLLGSGADTDCTRSDGRGHPTAHAATVQLTQMHAQRR